MKYRVSMGEEKVCLILSMHKAKTRLIVVDFLDKGWKTWSAQGTNLQLLRADYDNRKKKVLEPKTVSVETSTTL